jgi:hypothetical protein
MNQTAAEDKSKPTINQIPTVLNKGSLFIQWYLKSSLSLLFIRKYESIFLAINL